MEQQTTTSKDVPNTKEMVRKLEETAGVANGMLENLHIQGEQMDRIIDMNNSHSDQLHTAEKLTRQLSFSGRISNLFRRNSSSHHHQTKPQMSKETPVKKEEKKEKKEDKKEKNEKKNKKEPEEELSPEDALWKERSDPNYVPPAKSQSVPSSPGAHPADLNAQQLQLVEEQDRDLDQMANILYSLKEMSKVTQTELQSQSKKIDVMDEQVEKNLYTTKKTTAKLAKYG